MAKHLETGKQGEDAAVKLLRKNGYSILQRNFACDLGEIDVVAFKDGKIVFVEVKTRTSEEWGKPAEAVDSNKQNKIIRAAQYYLKSKRVKDYEHRYDVVGIRMDREGNVTGHEIITEAFF